MPKPAYEKWLTQEGLDALTQWAREGLSDRRMAEKCDIAWETFSNWKRRFPAMADALTTGRGKAPKSGRPPGIFPTMKPKQLDADEEVEKALLNKCMGYTVPLRKIYKLKRVEYGENGRKVREWEELRTGTEETHVPADTSAQKYWLANRMQGRWRDKPEAPADETALERAEELLGGVEGAL